MRYIIFIILIMLGSLNAAFAVDLNKTISRNFWRPMFHGQRLSYCSICKNQCGIAIAKKYCRQMGYAHADKAIIDNNVGLTHDLLVQARCKGWECNGFKLIRCVGELPQHPYPDYYYREHRFFYPRFNHYRIDWCYEQDKGCGKRAAYSFCRRMGYEGVTTYVKEVQVAATQAIGNQKLCFGKTCNGFQSITCYR